MDQNDQFFDKVIHVIRFGLEGRAPEARALARKIVQEYRSEFPERARALSAAAGSGATVRASKRPLPIDADSRLALAKLVDTTFAPKPVLDPSNEIEISRLLREFSSQAALSDAGLSPTRSVLLVGPPGVGKTMTAAWIASSLEKPLVVVDLASTVSSFLGKTGQNLRQIFDYAKESGCVLLIDEVDAVAKKRSDDTDLGELKRLVNVLLQELDDWPEGSVLLAATNHPDLLDPAIWRRFERVVAFCRPSLSARRTLLGASFPKCSETALEVLSIASIGMSHSEVVRRVNLGRKAAIIDMSSEEEAVIAEFYENIAGLPSSQRIEIGRELLSIGISQRKVAEITGTSRNTLRSHRPKSDKVTD